MNALLNRLSLVCLSLAALVASATDAAEIRILDRVTVEPGIVRLGDIAELYGAPEAITDALADVELFPAPTTEREKTVRSRRVIDILVRRGVDFGEHRISGASRITLVPAEKPEEVAVVPSRPTPRPRAVRLDRDEIVGTEAVVEQSIQRLLNRKVAAQDELEQGDMGWLFDLKLSPQQAGWIYESGNRFSVSGGVAPFTGRQRFEIAAVTATEEVREFTVMVDVKRPRRVVVSKVDLPRGTVILESDVHVELVADLKGREDAATRLEEVVGKEATGSLKAGKPVFVRQVREPILVQRGEVVAVVALAGGIRVETQGKARQDGSQGQLIVVETVPKPGDRRFKRQTFQARVSGNQEVEVFAGAVASR